MAILLKLLPIIQITLSVLLVGAVLLQRPVTDTGALSSDSFQSGHTKRGFEQTLHRATIVIAILFAASAVFALIASK